MYLDGGMGGGGWLLTSFFSIIYILGLVCYKHTIHVITIHVIANSYDFNHNSFIGIVLKPVIHTYLMQHAFYDVD